MYHFHRHNIDFTLHESLIYLYPHKALKYEDEKSCILHESTKFEP